MRRGPENAVGAGLARCGNCAKVWPVERLRPAVDLLRRLEPGDVFPSGECPECGALAIPYQQTLWSGPKLVRERARFGYNFTPGVPSPNWDAPLPRYPWSYTSRVYSPRRYELVLATLAAWWSLPGMLQASVLPDPADLILPPD
jgi:hypothetical protein